MYCGVNDYAVRHTCINTDEIDFGYFVIIQKIIIFFYFLNTIVT